MTDEGLRLHFIEEEPFGITYGELKIHGASNGMVAMSSTGDLLIFNTTIPKDHLVIATSEKVLYQEAFESQIKSFGV